MVRLHASAKNTLAGLQDVSKMDDLEKDDGRMISQLV
jgi:hypothetical protein